MRRGDLCERNLNEIQNGLMLEQRSPKACVWKEVLKCKAGSEIRVCGYPIRNGKKTKIF